MKSALAAASLSTAANTTRSPSAAMAGSGSTNDFMLRQVWHQAAHTSTNTGFPAALPLASAAGTSSSIIGSGEKEGSRLRATGSRPEGEPEAEPDAEAAARAVAAEATGPPEPVAHSL